MEVEAVENSQAQSMGGAGVQSGQLMAEKGVEAVLTGNAGPNAFRTLQAASVKIISGVSGTVKEVVEQYKKGELQATDNPTVESHFGMKGGG
jgi:predicted Fe-Mo cluster-binding NifX family protein